MHLGRPRLLKLAQVNTHTAELLRQIFRSRDAEFGEYWEVITQGTPDRVQSLCIHLQNKGYSDFVGQCAPDNPHSYVSRILEGRCHPKFPKARRDAQMEFLSRFVAVGKYISARTWKRSIARPDGKLLSSPNIDLGPEINLTEDEF